MWKQTITPNKALYGIGFVNIQQPYHAASERIMTERVPARCAALPKKIWRNFELSSRKQERWNVLKRLKNGLQMNKNNNRKWQDYQKEIAEDDYYYARSCIRQNFFPGSEETFLRILREILGKNIYDDPHQTTCTGIAYHSDIVPLETTMTVAARQFSLMNEAKYKNFIPSCVTSFGIYTEMIDTWTYFPETLENTKRQLYAATGRNFTLPENLVHTSDIIYKHKDEIANIAKYRLINKETD